MSRRFVVGLVEEIPPGTMKVVYPGRDKAGIGVFNVGGEFYALRNFCPHMGAPLCQGVITGMSVTKQRDDGGLAVEWIRDGEVIICPWHHWEFDIETGRTIFPSPNRVRSYPVGIDQHVADMDVEVDTYPVSVERATVFLELN